MKIYLYDHWAEIPEAFSSPVKSVGKAIYIKKATNMSIDVLNRNKGTILSNQLNENAELLVKLKDKDYHNEFIGNWNECLEYIEICLSDENIIKKNPSRKRLN